MDEENIKILAAAIRMGAFYDIIKTIVPAIIVSLIIFLIYGDHLTFLEILGSGALAVQLHKVVNYVLRFVWAEKSVTEIFNKIEMKKEEDE